MTIQKFFKIVLLAVFMACTVQSNASSVPTVNKTAALPVDNEAEAKLAAHIVQRVTEIQDMDKTNLTTAEKRDLRKELRTMEKQAGGLNQKVYLSIGAIIIIILILILVLR